MEWKYWNDWNFPKLSLDNYKLYNLIPPCHLYDKNIQIIIANLRNNYGISVPLPVSSPCFINTKSHEGDYFTTDILNWNYFIVKMKFQKSKTPSLWNVDQGIGGYVLCSWKFRFCPVKCTINLKKLRRLYFSPKAKLVDYNCSLAEK